MTGDLAADGSAVLERFLDEPLLAGLRREVDAAVRAPSPPGCDRPHNRLVPLRWNDATVDLILAGDRRRRAVATVIDLPDFAGRPADLELDRTAPAASAVRD